MDKIRVEVVYPLPNEQRVFSIEIPQGTTAEEAIRISGVLDYYPEIDLSKNKIGIYSQLVSLDTVLEDQQRIEIYRPLMADPKELRKQRAQQAKDEGRANKKTGSKER